MKDSILAMIFTLATLSCSTYAQGDEETRILNEFYQEMAKTDARNEALLSFTSMEDETDFWRDQHNFEKQLKEKNYSAYKTYIYFKRKSYQEHQQECDISINHGKGYNTQAGFYKIHGQNTLLGQYQLTEDLQAIPALFSHRN